MDIDSVLDQLHKQSQASSAFITDELRQIRTGKASPALVDGLEVTTYGGTTTLTLRELASISSDGATTILIDPFDASVTQDIEKAIRVSPLGLNPAVDGKTIRLTIPALDEEQRTKFTKLVGEKIEHGKVQLRQHRDHARKNVKVLLESKTITEDDKFRIEKEIDTITKDYSDKLDELRKKKTDEIMQI
jgi:ribosome recycling factor